MKVVVSFDLDDTLYKEINFLKSAYKEIAFDLQNEIGKNIYFEMLAIRRSGGKVFEQIIKKYKLKCSVDLLLTKYRNHKPNISPLSHAIALLKFCKKQNYKLALITDGRSVSQRNKLESLKIANYFDDIIISEEIGSEKPNKRNFQILVDKYPEHNFYYIGDNISKDFLAPNGLGWLTICINDIDETNIHSQMLEVSKNYRPSVYINNLKEIKEILLNKNKQNEYSEKIFPENI
jgi:putative hydrolase of the HAD superfamily